MKKGIVGGGCAMIGVGSFHLANGGAKGPYTLGLSVVLIVLGMLGLLVAFAIPEERRERTTSPAVRIGIALTVLALLLGLLAISQISPSQSNLAPVGLVVGSDSPQRVEANVPSPPPLPSSPPPPPPTAVIEGAVSGSAWNFQNDQSAPAATPLIAKPVYEPPPDQPGQPTELAGGPEGWQFQICDGQRRSAVGFRCVMGSWAGKPAVARFEPIFERGESPRDDRVILGREGYAVGGVQVVASDLVNAVRVVFARQDAEGALDTSDIYYSEWVGDPGDKKPTFLGEAGTRVIGVCGRHGAVINALALIVDRTNLGAAPVPDRFSATGNAATAKQPAPKQAEPEYKPPANLPGKPTNLVGGPEGWQYEMVDRNRKAVVGFRYKMGGWGGQAAVGQLDPLFNRNEAAQNGNLVMARGGYVVGGVQVVAGDLVNAVRIIFVRQASGGALDKSDFYLSDWIGDPRDESPKILGDGQTRVIGVCGRHGLVINALALVLDKR